MRLLRLRLRSFRGIADREVVFARDGVTVVEGPNEIGKSSLAEALDLLLEELDSANTKELRSVKPADRDAGPEVELEAESGPYAFVYRKRFLKDRETVLRVSRPRPESLTGREAHERVRAILAETADLGLWRALRLTQGSRVEQATVGGAGTLAAALDRAAGTVPEGPVEVSLWDGARAEYSVYFTDGGRAKGEAAAVVARLAEAQRGLDETEAELRKLDEDVARVARLRTELADLAERRAQAVTLSQRRNAQWQQIQTMVATVTAAEATATAKRLDAEQKAGLVAVRSRLVGEQAKAAADRDRLAAVVAAAAPNLATVRERATAAAQGLQTARAVSAAADADDRARRAEVEYLRALGQLGALTTRRARVEAVRAALATAQALVAANRVDDPALARIRAADLTVQTARALRDAGQPSVVITALAAAPVEIDGEPLALTPNQPVRRSVADALEIVAPGHLSIRVVAGTSGEQGARAVAEAEDKLRLLCASAGVADLASAERAARTRGEAATAVDVHQRTLADMVGADVERGTAELSRRIAAFEAQIAGQEATPDTRPAEELESALKVAETAAAAAATMAEDCRAATAQRDVEDRTVRDGLAELETTAAGDQARAAAAADIAAAAVALVAAARADVTDAQLEADAVAAGAGSAASAAEAASARATLAAENPEAVQALLDNAAKVRDGIAETIRTAELERAGARARLVDRGEAGLAERRDALLTARDAVAREREVYDRAAVARRLLLETLKAARDEAHLAYIGPLRERVEALGRIVFGPTLEVAIGDTLQVQRRTLNGTTLPFESLSVGAREQLGIITRLACAMIVSSEGGVPVLLDDGLGWSDKDRLEAMGAVLKVAGEACQVIVLTCYPDRYRSVGGAHVVRLG